MTCKIQVLAVNVREANASGEGQETHTFPLTRSGYNKATALVDSLRRKSGWTASVGTSCGGERVWFFRCDRRGACKPEDVGMTPAARRRHEEMRRAFGLDGAPKKTRTSRKKRK